MIAVIRRRGERRRHAENVAVLQAIRLLKPSLATEPPIARLAGVNLVRVFEVLARLEEAGVVTSEWQPTRPFSRQSGHRVYRAAGSRLTEAGR